MDPNLKSKECSGGSKGGAREILVKSYVGAPRVGAPTSGKSWIHHWNVVLQILVKFQWRNIMLRVGVVVRGLPCSESYWTVTWKNNSGTCHCSVMTK